MQSTINIHEQLHNIYIEAALQQMKHQKLQLKIYIPYTNLLNVLISCLKMKLVQV